MLHNPGLVKHFKTNKAFLIMTLFYHVVSVLFGMDYGFIRYKIVPLKLVKLLSVVTCITYTILLVGPPDYYQSLSDFMWLVGLAVKYDIFALYLIFLKDYQSFAYLHKELLLIDVKCGIDVTQSNLELKILGTCLAWVFYKTCYSIIYCAVGEMCARNAASICLSLTTTGTEIFFISYTFIFYLVYCRLKKIVYMLEKAETQYLTHQYTYKLYVDFVEKCKNAFGPAIVICLCFTIPEVMLNIYIYLKERRFHTRTMNGNGYLAIFDYLIIMTTLAATFIPAVVAGLLSAQAERIKLVLHNKLLHERDDSCELVQIERFIRYVEARECRLRVYKLIPLDVSLIGMVVSFCVTYLIVIVQFTNLY